VVDASAVLHLAGAGIKVSARHKLLAPTLLRSQVLSALHEAVRLLGDAVLRRRAWELADAFVTLDIELARSVEGIVATASIDSLAGRRKAPGRPLT